MPHPSGDAEPGAPGPRFLSPQRLAGLIDHTLLKPDATKDDVAQLCEQARRHRFCSVCVNPVFVSHARARLEGSGVKVCSVVGFPLGAHAPQVKAAEARKALRDGAQEIDMVLHVGALKARDDKLVLQDIRGVVRACKAANALCKVIIETCLLNDEEKVRACELSARAGADFVKTSTGFAASGATADDIALMSRTVAPHGLGVKASGGVRTYADVLKMIAAGATRVGCSSSIRIMEEAAAAAAGKDIPSGPASGSY